MARLNDFGPDTWVVRYGYQDVNDFRLYIAGLYFTFATITTVGFGDISGGTEDEQIICIIVMLIGVISFSFATGTLSSILSNIDSQKAKLKSKLGLLHEIKQEYNLSNALYDDLRQALKYDHSRYLFKLLMLRNVDDTVEFVNELPHRLRMELAYRIHEKVHQNISFFKDKPKDFLFQLSKYLRPIRSKKGQYIYKEGEPAVESKAFPMSYLL